MPKAFLIYLFLFMFCCGSACAGDLPQSPRSLKAEAKYTKPLRHELREKQLALGSPVFLRIVKTRSPRDRRGYLEVFVENEVGDFILLKRWDICAYSGKVGPKRKQGDRQAPEGFYFVKPHQMNPYSSYHLSFNLGYPNAYDRAHNRTGDFLMVHGDCVSIGCYAMTDEGIEEIYTLVGAALKGGQPFVRVHAFPFPMTDENLEAYTNNVNIAFWENLKTGWDWFEETGRPPNVNVAEKRYVFSEAK